MPGKKADKERSLGDATRDSSLLKATLESTADGILVVDSEGKVVGRNQRFLELWNIPSDMAERGDDNELLGFVVDQLADPETFLNKVRFLYEHPELESMDEIHFKDGRILERYSRPQLIDKTPVGRVWSFRDVTSSKKAQIELQESEVRYRSIFESSSDCICVISPELKILSMNPAGMAMNGLSSVEEFAYFDILSTILTGKDEVLKAMEQALQGIASSVEYSTKNLRGESVIWDARITPLRDEQGYVRSIMRVSRDITAKKQLQESRMNAKRIESLGVLAGGIAHDFNNILTAILGNISLVKDKLGNEASEVKVLLSEAELGCERAHRLTKQLLTFARGGAPIKQNVELRTLLKEACELASAGSICKCVLDLGKKEVYVAADAGQLAQVINNILMNARQAMPKGGKIKVTLKERPNEKVEISFKDEGPGIPVENLSRIFEPYFTTKDNGSGLGLAIAYSIIKNHNGAITAGKLTDGGAEFTIVLPKAMDTSVAELFCPAPEQPGASVPLSGRTRVLVMDDEPLIRDLLTSMLEHLGCHIETAQDGTEAIKLYRSAIRKKTPYDVVILDLTIPGGKGGKEVMAELMKLHPEIKAIVSSGYSNSEVMSDYGSYGFKAVIPKPYDMHELKATIQRVLCESDA